MTLRLFFSSFQAACAITVQCRCQILNDGVADYGGADAQFLSDQFLQFRPQKITSQTFRTRSMYTFCFKYNFNIIL